MALVPAAYSGVATALGYPLGFIFVVLAPGNYITENTLEPIIPLAAYAHSQDAAATLIFVGHSIGWKSGWRLRVRGHSGADADAC